MLAPGLSLEFLVEERSERSGVLRLHGVVVDEDLLEERLAAVADDGLTVLLSSHILAELERVCDYLIVISAGRVQIAGEIDDLLASHRLLTGPAGGLLDEAPGVIHVTRGDRHAHAIVRTGGGAVMPGWQSGPIGLEDLVLAYLHRAPATSKSRQETLA